MSLNGAKVVTYPQLILGDCIEQMTQIPSGSIDMILCDLPYGTTACKWDVVIPLDQLWQQYWRVIKKNGAVLLFGTEPFSSFLRMNQIKSYKYDWTWVKNLSTNFLHAKRMPLRKSEIISVFYKKQCTYNPVKSLGHKPTQSAKGSSDGVLYFGKNNRNYPGGDTSRFPTNILDFKVDDPKIRSHPTQKPVLLLEYLINTYTNEGEVVPDNCMGSGSTGVACINTRRMFIGIEKDEKYFSIAKDRIAEANGAKDWSNIL